LPAYHPFEVTVSHANLLIKRIGFIIEPLDAIFIIKFLRNGYVNLYEQCVKKKTNSLHFSINIVAYY